MKTISIRDLRQKWPEAEALLQVENEVLITRDSKPVARLTRYQEKEKSRRQFDPEAHGRWQKKMSRGKVVQWVNETLLTERDEG